MFIKIDDRDFVYWLNINRIIAFIPKKDHTEIMVNGLDYLLKTAETVLSLIQKVEVGKKGLVTPSDFIPKGEKCSRKQ